MSNFHTTTGAGFVFICDRERSCVLLQARDIGNARDRAEVALGALRDHESYLLGLKRIDQRVEIARELAREAVADWAREELSR